MDVVTIFCIQLTRMSEEKSIPTPARNLVKNEQTWNYGVILGTMTSAIAIF
jgi:hypothetical protein